MIRTAFIAMAVAGALGGFALTAGPAPAGPVSPSTGRTAQAGDGLIGQAQYHRAPRRHYGLRPSDHRPRCFWSERRVWDGWRWVVRPVRVCR